MKEQAILVDTTHCTGCNSCTYKCIQEFGDQEIAARGIFRTVVQIKDEGMLRTQCMHCKDPQCVKASSAVTKTPYGAVLVDAAKLNGSGKAIEKECPFHAVHYDDESKKLSNCNLCAHRLAEGKQPACVEACPASALQSGDYEVMVGKAKKLAAERKLKTYGLEENGGTHIIILTKADPAVLGYPTVAKKTMKAQTMTNLAAAPLVAGAVVVGLKKYSDRRAAIRESEKEK